MTARYELEGMQRLLILNQAAPNRLQLQSYQQVADRSSRPDSMSVSQFQRLPHADDLSSHPLPPPQMQTLW